MGAESDDQLLNRVKQESLKTVRQLDPKQTKVIPSSINQVVEQQLNAELIKFEPLNPDQRMRANYEPVGLKNIGNSKYPHFEF